VLDPADLTPLSDLPAPVLPHDALVVRLLGSGSAVPPVLVP